MKKIEGNKLIKNIKKNALIYILSVLVLIVFTLIITTRVKTKNKKIKENNKKIYNEKAYNEKNENKVEELTYTPKETSFALDNTTEVLIDDLVTKKDNILKIVKHGDHWHVFTKDGKEHITYKDPEKGSFDEADNDIVNVVSLDFLKTKNIVKIKVHGNHWHVYDNFGREYITYKDPTSLFNTKVEKYIPPVVTEKKENNKIDNNSNKRKQIIPNVIKILKHEDHWHLYTKDGKEFITHQDPAKDYPNIEIKDFYEGHVKKVENEEMFKYEDVEAKLIVPLEDIDYGGIIYTVDFDKETQKFIVPHLDHFHNISIETIIGLSKDKEIFKGHSARDIVSTLKYLVEHKEARPKKEGWGDNTGKKLDDISEEEKEKNDYLILEFIKNKYKTKEIQRIGEEIYIYINDQKIVLNFSDFIVKGKKVIPNIKLPEVKIEEKTENKIEEKDIKLI